MQLVLLFFIFVILIGSTTLSKSRIDINPPSGLAELEDAAIQVLLTCYANQTKTIVLAVESSSSLIERLSSHESFALVSLHDRIRSENRIAGLGRVDKKRKHKVDILVAMAPYHDWFESVLWDFQFSLYDNPMALTLLLVWSPEEKDAGCNGRYKTATFFYHSNMNNHLNTILMCHHCTNGIMMYSSNPFKNQAPEPWQLVPFEKTVIGRKFFYFVRKYRVNEEMCKNLAFDKTRDVNGSTIEVAWAGPVVRHKNEIKPQWSPMREVRLEAEQIFGLISSFISYVNASMELSNRSAEEFTASRWNKYEVFPYSIRTLENEFYYYAYPNTRVSFFLISQFRGNKSQLGKILSVIDEYSWVGMFFVYFVTLLFFKYFLRQPLLVGILNLCRLTCNWGLTTLPRNVASRIYLSCLLFFVVTMQGIFTGNLASLLTHDFPVRQVNSIQDVIDLNYTVYCNPPDVILFDDPHLKDRIIRLEGNEDCIEKVKLDARSVCAKFTPYYKHVAAELNLYMSNKNIAEDWACNIVPWKWGLLERFNAFQGILIAAGAALPFQTMVEKKRWLEAEATEIPLQPKVMTLKNLHFAFVILGIGLVCATIIFIGEITIHWYYRRVTTTRVIVLKR